MSETAPVVDGQERPTGPEMKDGQAATKPMPGNAPQREERPRSRGRVLARTVAPPVVALVALAGIWQAAVVALNVPLYILPPPSRFIGTIGSSRAVLWSATLVTGQEILYGFLLGIAVGVPLALVFALIPILREALYPVIVFFQVIPKIALAPMVVVWFGAGQLSVTLITFALCLFPILVNSMAGFMNIDERLLYITRSMGASRWQTFRYLRLQSALPFIFAGLRVAVVLATTGAIVGEFVGSNAGLGTCLIPPPAR